MIVIKLVKYDYDSFPEEWKKIKINPPEYDKIFAFLGEVKQMKGHGYYQDIDTGQLLHFRH